MGFFGCVHISYFSLIVPHTIVINGQVSPNELPRKGGSNIYLMNIFYLALRWYTKGAESRSWVSCPISDFLLFCLNNVWGFVFLKMLCKQGDILFVSTVALYFFLVVPYIVNMGASPIAIRHDSPLLVGGGPTLYSDSGYLN